MPRSPRPARRALRFAAVVIAILTALLAGATSLINHLFTPDSLRQALAGPMQNFGATIEFRSSHIALLPMPHLTLDDVRFAFSGQAAGSVQTLAVYPRIVPLLRGLMQVARLRIDAAAVTVDLPVLPGSADGMPTVPSPPALHHWLQRSLRDLDAWARHRVPGLELAISNATVVLRHEGSDPLALNQLSLQAELPPGGLSITLRCQSNLWQALSVDGTVDVDRFTGAAEVALTRVDLAALSRHLGTSSQGLVATTPTDVALRVGFEPADTMEAQLRAQIPTVTVSRPDRSGSIGGGTLDARLVLSGSRAALSLSKLDLQAPRLSVVGELSIDDAAPVASLTVHGAQIDIAPLASGIALIIGDQPIARAIFEVLQSGMVPAITLEARAASADRLFDTGNYSLHGELVGGRILVPTVNLQLEDVTGEASVANGILEGVHAQGRLGASTARDGRVRVALTDAAAHVFLLDTEVQADVGALPSVLHELVPNPDFRTAMQRITHAEGQAQGRLTLRDTPNGFQTHVTVTSFTAAVDAQFLPDRLRLSGGRFEYDPTALEFADVRAEMGQSWVSAAAARVDANAPPRIEAQAGDASLSLSDLRAWLAALGATLSGPSPVSGTLTATGLWARGPLWSPERWQLDVAGGRAIAAEIDLRLLPDHAVVSGYFETAGNDLTLANAQVTFADATLTGSGILTDYRSGRARVEVSADGQIGPHATATLLEMFDLDYGFKIHGPLAVSGGRLAVGPGTVAVAGTFSVQAGPSVSLDAQWDAHGLMLRQLAVRDKWSDARLTASVRSQVSGGDGRAADVDLGFAGYLTARTVDELLQYNPYLEGAVRGDFRLDGAPQPPFRMEAQGTLSAKGLAYPLAPDDVVRVEHTTLHGAGAHVDVQPSIVAWGDERMQVSGIVTPETDGATVDLRVRAAAFDWDRVAKRLTRDRDRDRHSATFTTSFPVRGTVDLQYDAFHLDGFTWRPLRAKIALAPDVLDLTIDDANLCGVHTAGDVRFYSDRFDLALSSSVHGEDLITSIACLFDRDLVDGRFDLTAEVTGGGYYVDPLEGLQGDLDLTARDGRIYRSGILSNLFSVLSTTQIFSGRLPDLRWNSLAYQTLQVSAQIEEGSLVINDAVLESSALSLVASGAIDLRTARVDLVVLAAPLRFVTSVVEHIPLLGRLWPKRLVSVPIRVTGDLADPKVVPLSPSAVTSQLLGVLHETVKLPIDLIQPLWSGRASER